MPDEPICVWNKFTRKAVVLRSQAAVEMLSGGMYEDNYRKARALVFLGLFLIKLNSHSKSAIKWARGHALYDVTWPK